MNTQMKNQQGRTLLEVVRTLAITAVILFLLFLFGKWMCWIFLGDADSEDTIKEIHTRSISASVMLMHNQNPVDKNFEPTTRQGYNIELYEVGNRFFEIAIYPVPKPVCERIVKKNWSAPTSLYINDQLVEEGGETLCQETNRMGFEFANDLQNHIPNSQKPVNIHCQSNADCDDCSSCRNGRCQTSCQTDEVCAKNLKGHGTCCAPKNQVGNLCCSYIENDMCCWGRDKCCPKDRPIPLPDGTCTDCYDNRIFTLGFPANDELCHTLCPNRKPFGLDQKCMLSICGAEKFLGSDGQCYACDTPGGVHTSSEQCRLCSDRTEKDGVCFLPCRDGMIEDKDHQCQPCQKLENIVPAIANTCALNCPNREKTQAGCALKVCPEGYISDSEGNCLECDSKEAFKSVKEEDCARCPGREMQAGSCVRTCQGNVFRGSDNVCYDCSDVRAIPVLPKSGECAKCSNRIEMNGYCFADCPFGQFRDAYGSCRSCVDRMSYLVSKTDACHVCPNRTILLTQKGNQITFHCTLQYCPPGTFVDKTGNCSDCFIPTAVSNTAKNECEKCENRMWSPTNEACFIKQTCREKEFIDTEGNCRSCQDPEEAISVRGSLEQCDMCPNRYIYGYWCRKCPVEISSLTDGTGCEKCGGVWDNRLQKCEHKAISQPK